MISVENLTKFYGRGDAQTQALADVSLEITEGEFVSFIGTSGSGKTTLLNIIGGLDQDYKGSVTIRDQRLDSLSENAVSKLRSEFYGFVFQQFNLLDHLTSVENVALPAFFTDMPLPDARDRARELLGNLGLESKTHARPPALSGGQKQRVAIARALFGSPRVLLCDEPTGSLDRKTGIEILDIFRDLNADGITVVMVTHEEHIAEMSRRIVRFEDGRIISDHANKPKAPEREILVAEEAS